MKKLFSTLMIFFATTAMLSAFSGSGSGTVGDPYQITDVYELQEMNTDNAHRAAHYKLMNDIDASVTSTWNGGDGFIAVGTDANRFTGSLDGQNYEISDLYINVDPLVYRIGLFGYTDGATIENVGLVDVNITGEDAVGGLAGYLVESTVQNCFTTGTIIGEEYTGGFAAIIRNSNVTNCYSSCSISGSPPNGWHGGFCGLADGISGGTNSISKCYATGSVSGGNYTGGFCGENDENSTISECYATGDVTGAVRIGGFVGVNNYEIRNCYSWGDVTTTLSYAGGFIGHNLSGSVIENCYSVGAVSASSTYGGFCAMGIGSTITKCYWDINTSGQATSSGGSGRTTTQMKQQATFVNWDFVWIWFIDEGNQYPLLGIAPIPTLSEWATIVLGGLLLIAGGWFVWRKAA